MPQTANRPLTGAERELVRVMLERGTPEAKSFLDQVELAEVTPWQCPCGCASFNLQLQGHPPAPPGVHILGEFLFGEEDELSGIFVFCNDGRLSGVEVYGLAGDAPKVLPKPESLRPWSAE